MNQKIVPSWPQSSSDLAAFDWASVPFSGSNFWYAVVDALTVTFEFILCCEAFVAL